MSFKNVRTPNNEQVLLVSDSADELHDIQRLLTEDFGHLLKAHDEIKGLHLFTEHHPILLVLAFQEIEKAEHFYLSLYRHDNHIHENHHQTLLLCKNTESDKAYQLCKNGTFNDFVVDRPLYDPFRLRLSVMQALNRRSQKQQSSLLNEQMNKFNLELQQFDKIIREKLASGDGQHQETVNTFQYFTKKIGADLEKLEENLIHSGFENHLPEMDKEKLRHQFNQFRHNSLQKESQIMVDQLNKTGDWLKEISNSYSDNITSVQKNQTEQIHIMLVDDDDFYRDTFISMLHGSGLQIMEVEDGKSALIELQTSQPDLILLDYKMPGLDGIETLKNIKSNPNTASIPVVMLTGASEREIVKQCLNADATDFIVKPSDRETILSKINEVLN